MEPDVSLPKTAWPSPFRMFCNDKWFEHKDEILAWTGKALEEYDSTYYFQKHRWLLKRMWKDEQKEHKKATGTKDS